VLPALNDPGIICSRLIIFFPADKLQHQQVLIIALFSLLGVDDWPTNWRILNPPTPFEGEDEPTYEMILRS